MSEMGFFRDKNNLKYIYSEEDIICEKCNKIKSNSYNRKAENGNIEKEILKNWVDNVENTLKLLIDFSTHEVFFSFKYACLSLELSIEFKLT